MDSCTRVGLRDTLVGLACVAVILLWLSRSRIVGTFCELELHAWFVCACFAIFLAWQAEGAGWSPVLHRHFCYTLDSVLLRPYTLVTG